MPAALGDDSFPSQPSTRRLIAPGQLCLAGDAHAKVAQETIAKTVNPAVHREFLASPPGFLNNRLTIGSCWMIVRCNFSIWLEILPNNYTMHS